MTKKTANQPAKAIEQEEKGLTIEIFVSSTGEIQVKGLDEDNQPLPSQEIENILRVTHENIHDRRVAEQVLQLFRSRL